jgi:Putative heavy-metal-binding
MSDVIVTTMNDLPGYRVTQVFGEVFGLTVRSRNIGSDIGASLKGLVGGEVKGYTKMRPTVACKPSTACATQPVTRARTRSSRCASTATR